MNPISRSAVQESISRQSLHSKYFYDKKYFGHETTDDEDDDDYDDECLNENDDVDEENHEKRKQKIKQYEVNQSIVGHSECESNENFEIKKTSNNQDHKFCQHYEKYHAIQSGSDCDSSSNGSHCSIMTRSRVSSKSLGDQNHDMQSLTTHKQTIRHCLRKGFSDTEQLRQADLCIDCNMADPDSNNIKKSRSTYCGHFNRNNNEPILTDMRIRANVIGDCSRRPIRCPRLDCAVNVAFSALTHHFVFDHPEVPILSVEPGAKSTLAISFTSLSCDSSCCLAVLLVSSKLTGTESKLFNGNLTHPKHRDRLPLTVLAARLHYTDHDTIHDNVNSMNVSSGKSDIIIAWISGLDIINVGDLHCTIQAVDNLNCNGIRSLSYRGPINSLRSAQRPNEVFLSGDCLILHEGLLKHLTTNSSTLNINVIIHV